MSTKPLGEEELTKQAVLLATDLYFWKTTGAARSMSAPPPGGMDPEELSRNETLVRDQIEKPTVKKVICAALATTTTEFRSVAQVVVAALLPLAVTKTIDLPLTPVALAVAAVHVFNVGVAIYCADLPSST